MTTKTQSFRIEEGFLKQLKTDAKKNRITIGTLITQIVTEHVE